MVVFLLRLKDSWEQIYFVLSTHSAKVNRISQSSLPLYIKCETCSPLKGTMVTRAISSVVL